MFPGFNADALVQLLAPKAKEFLTPIFAEARQELLKTLSGPPPVLFTDSMRRMFNFTDEQLAAIWSAAISAALEAWGKSNESCT